MTDVCGDISARTNKLIAYWPQTDLLVLPFMLYLLSPAVIALLTVLHAHQAWTVIHLCLTFSLQATMSQTLVAHPWLLKTPHCRYSKLQRVAGC
jgi:membrane protein YdbS with pleckstrin-like domain